ncbi:MAG: 4Fe-4S dicluster domain-containing protein [Thermoplasmata archaeon]
MAKYAMAIDLDRCTGCRACMEACKVENNTPEANFWMYVFRFEEGKFPNTRISFVPRPCQHCDNAPCVIVCPVGARYKRADGLVATDWDRCIGCRYCEVACPYGVNYFNWKEPSRSYYLGWGDGDLASATGGMTPPYRNPDLDTAYGPEQRRTAGGGRIKGVIEKCTFCVQRVEKGLLPACVESCPTDVLHFGDIEDPESDVSGLLREMPHFRLLEEVGTHPSVFYLGGSPPSGEMKQIERVREEVSP